MVIVREEALPPHECAGLVLLAVVGAHLAVEHDGHVGGELAAEHDLLLAVNRGERIEVGSEAAAMGHGLGRWARAMGQVYTTCRGFGWFMVLGWFGALGV